MSLVLAGVAAGDTDAYLGVSLSNCILTCDAHFVLLPARVAK
jgi:hypothetical protein